MLNLILSDFYKLFKRKSFYVCAIIAMVMSCLGVILLNSMLNIGGIEVTAKEMGYNGIYALTTGIGESTLLVTILISMFVPSEFAFGTIKNIASKGISRASIYLSKFIICVFVCFIYTLLCAITSFTLGSIMWEIGDFSNQNVILDILRMFGLFLLAQIALESIFIMVGFIIRQTGGTVASNLAITIVVPGVIISFIDFACSAWLKIENFSAAKYWISDYLNDFLSLTIDQEIINRGLIVCICYILASTAIGIYTFYKRDIK